MGRGFEKTHINDLGRDGRDPGLPPQRWATHMCAENDQLGQLW